MTDNVRRIEAALKGVPCALCNGPAVHAGVFEPGPEFAKSIGQPAGTPVFYTLCNTCFQTPDWPERLEHVMFAELGVPVTERLQ